MRSPLFLWSIQWHFPSAHQHRFTLLDTTKTPVTLSSLKGQTVILAFFPAAFTGVCKAEMCSFQSAIQRLNSAKAAVLGVSADIPFSNGAFAKPTVSPSLSCRTSTSTPSAPMTFSLRTSRHQGLTRSSRATFVIDAEGIIRHVHVTENPGVEPNYDEIYAAAEAL
ncbi:MAG: redoxin domain-containing protein [Ignavibacteria bacterium]|nr:redoxin domain-containing protein [Ignavibacteria bacterium]